MKLRRLIPDFLKPVIKRPYLFFVNSIDMLKKRDALTPPKSLNFVGDGDYKQIGNEFKNYFINIGGLKSSHRVLDVGCGIGRMAVPLTNYLTNEGGYWGFDIVKEGIEWCQKNITEKFDHFNFLHVNIYNKYYNKKGDLAANQFSFPYETDFFDFVFLTSVFTHMQSDELENYLKEIARVLRPGGKALITFYLLNSESKRLIDSDKSRLDFRYEINENCKANNSKVPEDAIAYEEKFVLSLINKYQLAINQPIYYGSWCGREQFLSFQDLVLIRN